MNGTRHVRSSLHRPKSSNILMCSCISATLVAAWSDVLCASYLTMWVRPRPLASICAVQLRAPRGLAPLCAASDDKELAKQSLGTAVSRDVAVWMVLAFSTASTPLAPYVVLAGALAVAFLFANLIYKATTGRFIGEAEEDISAKP
eukprot:TRINITY_DN50763_c0_g1_i1.p1 TRINITY_DN50763_c0_g1~~TRINITY_DN50763_c0_g1_i1.p1  ORF type:complete len:146 (-),score=22.97 TRINITY_DN50763_c0_g1_i1:184-621(-)